MGKYEWKKRMSSERRMDGGSVEEFRIVVGGVAHVGGDLEYRGKVRKLKPHT